MTLTPQAFVNKWQTVDLKERSASQEHFLDLCALLGHPTPAEADPTGERFTFEAGAAKHSGGQGWADVWKKGYFAWEYKGRHADLDKAYDQLLQYREALENPPLLIVSDLHTLVIHTNFTNTVKQVHTLALNDLLDPAKLALLRHAFRRNLRPIVMTHWVNGVGLCKELVERTAAEAGKEKGRCPLPQGASPDM